MNLDKCIQMVVKINGLQVLNLLKEKGSELNSFVGVYGNFAVFSNDSSFSWKWIAGHLRWMDEMDDCSCIQFSMNCKKIVAALWQYSDGSNKWFACNGCSDDLIDDDVRVNQILSTCQGYEPASIQVNKANKPAAPIVSIPSLITKEWLVSLTPADWDILLEKGSVNFKILDEWENPVFKELNKAYGDLGFTSLALEAIKKHKTWKSVEDLKPSRNSAKKRLIIKSK